MRFLLPLGDSNLALENYLNLISTVREGQESLGQAKLSLELLFLKLSLKRLYRRITTSQLRNFQNSYRKQLKFDIRVQIHYINLQLIEMICHFIMQVFLKVLKFDSYFLKRTLKVVPSQKINLANQFPNLQKTKNCKGY